MSKIGYILNCSSLYGANQSILEVIKYIKKDNWEIFVFIPERGDIVKELRRNKISYAIVPYNYSVYGKGDEWYEKFVKESLNNLKCLFKMREIVKHEKIDIIHTNSLTHAIGAELAVITNLPHVWHIRELLKLYYGYRFKFPFLMKFLLKNSSRVICISKTVKDYYSKIIPFQTSLIYNPVSIASEEKNDVVWERDKTTFMICGVIIPEKGQEEAIDAVERLVKKGYTNIELFIVGDGESQYVKKLKNKIQKLHLETNVRFAGFLSAQELQKERQKCNIALICSANEAFGRAMVEAMLSGMFVIGTNSGGTKEIVGLAYGLLFQDGNVDDLTNKMQWAIEHCQECNEMAEKNKLFAEQEFNVSKSGKAIEKIYKSIMRKNKT